MVNIKNKLGFYFLILHIILNSFVVLKIEAKVVPYNNNVSVVNLGYFGGTYSPNQERIYLVPFNQGQEPEWHYIDCVTGNVVSYAHNTSAQQEAYAGGAYSPTLDRIYFSPYKQSDQPFWHYIDCSTGNIIPYAHNTNAVRGAYSNAVYSEALNRIYFAPYDQAKETEWHYINCSTGNVVAYSHNSNSLFAQRNAYVDVVYSETLNRIFFVPSDQGPQSEWHYIDCVTGNVVSYAHNVTVEALGYWSGTYSPTQDRIYFVPDGQASQSVWHYIDCSNGNIVPYAHNTSVQSYIGGAYLPAKNRIYFGPALQSSQPEWHYIDCNTGNIVPYAHNTSAVAFAYSGAVYSSTLERIYLVPFIQGPQPIWHYIIPDEDEILTSNYIPQSTFTDRQNDSLTSHDSFHQSNTIDISVSFTLQTEIYSHDSFSTQIIQNSTKTQKSDQNTRPGDASFQDFISTKVSDHDALNSFTSFQNSLRTQKSDQQTFNGDTDILDQFSTKFTSSDRTLDLRTKKFHTSVETSSSKINQQILSFNTIIEIEGLVFLKSPFNAGKIFQKPRISFINDKNTTPIEKALQQSIGYYSLFNVSNICYYEYSINTVTKVNTSMNTGRTLDKIILEITKNVKRDEEKLNDDSNKCGFDLIVDFTRAVINATEILDNGINLRKMFCVKSFGSVLMTCTKSIKEKNTFLKESSEDIDLEAGSSSSVNKFKESLLFYLVVFYFMFLFF